MAGWARLSGGSVSMDLLPGSRRAVCTASGSGTPSGLMMSRSLSVLRSRCRAGPKVPWTALPIPPQRPHCVEGSPRGEVILCGEDRGPELQSPAALLLWRLGSWGWVPGGQVPGAGWRGGGRLITTHAVNPLTMWAYLRIIRSSQPQRRFLPVVTPHSWPRLCSRSPISCGATERAQGLWGWSPSRPPAPPSHGP